MSVNTNIRKDYKSVPHGYLITLDVFVFNTFGIPLYSKLFSEILDEFEGYLFENFGMSLDESPQARLIAEYSNPVNYVRGRDSSIFLFLGLLL